MNSKFTVGLLTPVHSFSYQNQSEADIVYFSIYRQANSNIFREKDSHPIRLLDDEIDRRHGIKEVMDRSADWHKSENVQCNDETEEQAEELDTLFPYFETHELVAIWD